MSVIYADKVGVNVIQHHSLCLRVCVTTDRDNAEDKQFSLRPSVSYNSGRKKIMLYKLGGKSSSFYQVLSHAPLASQTI